MPGTFVSLPPTKWSFAALVALAAALPAQRDDLYAAIPANAVAVVEGHAAPATLRALVAAIDPLPGFALRPWLDDTIESATGVPLDTALAALLPAEFVVALIPAAKGPQLLLTARIVDRAAAATCIDAIRAHATPLAIHLDLDADRVTIAAAAHLDTLRASAANASYAPPPAAPATPGTLRLHVDLTRLPRAATSPWAHLDGGGRFLVGPIVTAIAAARTFTAECRADADGLHVEGRIDASIRAGAAAADPIATLVTGHATALPPHDALATLRLDRSLAAWLRDASTLLDDDDATAAASFLAIADSVLGASLPDVVLAGLREPITLVAYAPPANAFTATDAAPPATPRLALPEFVLIAAVTDRRLPPRLWRAMRVAGLIQAAERTQQGKAPFALDDASSDGVRRLVLRPPPYAGAGAPPLEHGIAPTLRTDARTVVLATTPNAAERAAAAFAQAGTAAPSNRDVVTGDVVTVDGEALAQWLQRHRDVAIAHRALDTGAAFDVAAAEVDRVLAFAATIGAVRLAWTPNDTGTDLSLRIARRRGR